MCDDIRFECVNFEAKQRYLLRMRATPANPADCVTAVEVAKRNGIPEAVFLALIDQESRWNRSALSPKGAIGLAQLIAVTA